MLKIELTTNTNSVGFVQVRIKVVALISSRYPFVRAWPTLSNIGSKYLTLAKSRAAVTGGRYSNATPDTKPVVASHKTTTFKIMEYFRTDDGQIQVDYARRPGIILKQYHEQIIATEKYEVSLSLSIPQSLLTNCTELLNNLKSIDKKKNPFYEYPIDSAVWGFDDNSIKHNTFFQPELTAEKIVRHIRNALSHPTKIDIKSPHKTTGYITKGDAALIETIVFVSSPDLNGKGNSKPYKTKEVAESTITRDGNFPDNV